MNDENLPIFLQEIVLQAGSLVRAGRNDANFQTEYKGSSRNLVTTTDKNVDDFLVSKIRETYPEHQILSEENYPEFSSPMLKTSSVWILDPIDGTTNFAYGHPQVAISVAYAKKGMVQCAAVYAPFTDELFFSVRGKGATLNGTVIAPTKCTELEMSLIATGFPYERVDVSSLTSCLERVLLKCRDVRRLGSAALDTVWVACGRLDGYYETVNIWDIAAARLIAQEAGAKVGTYIDSEDDLPEELRHRGFVVATPGIFDSLKQILRDP